MRESTRGDDLHPKVLDSSVGEVGLEKDEPGCAPPQVKGRCWRDMQSQFGSSVSIRRPSVYAECRAAVVDRTSVGGECVSQDRRLDRLFDREIVG